MANLTGSPYYDDYDSSKGYSKILAMPGRVLQAREFNQLQSIQQDQLSRVSNTLITNGTIIKGCNLIVNNKRSVSITEGQIFIDGRVRDVEKDTVIINGTGIEYIGAYIIDVIITETNDHTLFDPATDSNNYGEPGAHRLKEIVKYIAISAGTTDTSVVAHSNVAKVFTLVDGTVVKSNTLNTSPITNDLLRVLARRSYDENGSYKVRGIELQNRNEDDSLGIYVSISNGKAYVNGYEVDKVSSNKLRIDYCNDVAQRYNEAIFYESGTDSYSLDISPVRDLQSVSSQITVTETVNRSNVANGSDLLKNTPVYKILEVFDNNTTYEVDTDYKKDGSYVNWSASGNEPSPGSSYTVKYIYTRNMNLSTDVRLVNSYNSLNKRFESKIEFINENAKPTSDTDVYVSYNYYLARMDLVTLDQDGHYKIIKGTPSILNKAMAPVNQDDTTLNVGTVLISPGYTNSSSDEHLKNLVLTNYDSTRLSQANLRNMKERLDNLEYNQAMTDLDKEASDNEQASLLRGILTDGFIGLSKCDLGHPEFKCCIDIDNGYLTLPITSKEYTASINNKTTTATLLGSSYVAPYVEDVAVYQAQATESININPYSVYENRPVVTISPTVDKWKDSDKVNIQGTQVKYWQIKYNQSNSNDLTSYKELSNLSYSYDTDNITSVSTTSEIVKNSIITYMRQSEITITGNNFPANTDNITCYFNDTAASITPSEGYESGSLIEGSIKANSAGRFIGTITVPANIPCGVVEVRLVDQTGKINSSTIYTSINNYHNYLESNVVKIATDNVKEPVAQSFQFNTDIIISRLGLYFKQKDTSSRVIVQIKNMVNGYPGTTVFDEIVIEPSSISTSSNGTSETVVKFNRPVFCRANTEYCFTVMTSSTKFELWTATLGSNDIFTGYSVVTQPYSAGMLYTSFNNQIWTPHQFVDLKFRLHKATFTSKGIVDFLPVNATTMSSVILATNDADYKNDGIKWYFKANETDSWSPINPYNELELANATSTAYFRADLSATADTNTSPILYENTIDVIGLLHDKTGAYVSRTVYLENSFNTVQVSFEAFIPSGSEVKVFYSINNDTWSEISMEQGDQVDYNNWFRYLGIATLINSTRTYKVKLVMSSTSYIVQPKIRKLINILKNV